MPMNWVLEKIEQQENDFLQGQNQTLKSDVESTWSKVTAVETEVKYMESKMESEFKSLEARKANLTSVQDIREKQLQLVQQNNSKFFVYICSSNIF